MALVFHFATLFIYSKPFPSKITKFDVYANAYAYPYFHQNWNLFVPIPVANYHLYCIYENNGMNTVDIFSEIVIKHQENRFKGYEALVVAFTNSFHYFSNSTKENSGLNGPIKNDLNFAIIENAAKNYLEWSRETKIKNLNVILVTQQTHTNTQKIYFN